MKKINFALLFCLLFIANLEASQTKLAILKYKGGDWYSAMGAIKNFLNEANRLTTLDLFSKPEIVELRNRTKLFSHPFIILNGHGQILLDNIEKNNLKEYLENGGFLLVNDDYGLDNSFRKLIKEIYPQNELIELSKDFPLFFSYYKISELPKVHEHDGLSPQAFGLFINKRLVILYIFNADIIDGWEPESVHHDPKEIREKAVQFGINILYYVLTN